MNKPKMRENAQIYFFICNEMFFRRFVERAWSAGERGRSPGERGRSSGPGWFDDAGPPGRSTEWHDQELGYR